ncbi:hypothetical protein IWQ61_004057 [Dispira simplex]|nr:hypothetical protein IWQ61_004057 [Dispira simplex]
MWNWDIPGIWQVEGAHKHEVDMCFFHLPTLPREDDPSLAPEQTAYFGISSYRQISSNDLLVKTSDITRTFVQKAVVLILTQPVFGYIQDQIADITQLYFGQRDFTRTDILQTFYKQIVNHLQPPLPNEYYTTNTALGFCVNSFKSHSLALLKLLLAGAKVLCVDDRAEHLCRFQYSLLSIFPSVFPSLYRRLFASESTNGDIIDTTGISKQPLVSFVELFDNHSLLEPYFPMVELKRLEASDIMSCLAGTSNEWVVKNATKNFDVVIDLKSSRIDYINPVMMEVAALTSADRKFMGKLMKNKESPPIPGVGKKSRTSFDELVLDDYREDKLRVIFQDYVERFLCTVQWTRAHRTSHSIMEALKNDYGQSFLKRWLASTVYANWCHRVPAGLKVDVTHLGHPGSGASVFEDTRMLLLEQLDQSKLSSRIPITPVRDGIKNIFSAGSNLWGQRRTRAFSQVQGLWTNASSYFQNTKEPNRRESAEQ